jgi:hypothetical protein
VLAVDYGSDPDFADYWIVKNSVVAEGTRYIREDDP